MDMTVDELRDRMQADPPLTLVDVRQPEEHAICRIEGSRLIPLGELNARLSELNPDAPIAVYCKSGVRSASAVGLMRARGFRDVRNVAGGILAWIDRVDPSLPRY
jgi:adenylyltransferase/sulfurtransferase